MPLWQWLWEICWRAGLGLLARWAWSKIVKWFIGRLASAYSTQELTAMKIEELVDALASTSASDLDELDEEIQDMERQVTALKLFRKALALRVGKGGKDSTPPSGEGNNGNGVAQNGIPKSEVIDAYRQRLAKFLAVHGQVRVGKLQQACAVPNTSFQKAIDHEWFVRTTEGVCLTPSARQLFVQDD